MQNIKGADHELSFWKQFVQSDRFINGWLSNEKTPELNDLVYMFLLGQPDAKVLDCGSGVVSILHGTVKESNLTSADPLGHAYNEIFDYSKHGLVMPLPRACEDLTFKDLYDVVHISNALDHSQQPSVAFERMYRAVKPGGFLIVQGFVNEGTHEDWTGFHQWDLDLFRENQEGEGLKITDKHGAQTILSQNPYFARKIHIDLLGRDWLIWITRKPLEA
jgi:SAM-dependent methyltransferase